MPALSGGPGDDTWSSVRALRAARAVPARRMGGRGRARRARQPRLDPPARLPRHLEIGVLLAGRGRHRLQARLRAARLAPAALRGHRRTLLHRRGRALQLHPRPGHLPRRHRHPRRHPHPRGPPARRPGPLPARRDANWRPSSPSSSASPGTTNWSRSATPARAPRSAGSTRSSDVSPACAREGRGDCAISTRRPGPAVDRRRAASGPDSSRGVRATHRQYENGRIQTVRNASTTLCPPKPNESFSAAIRPSTGSFRASPRTMSASPRPPGRGSRR